MGLWFILMKLNLRQVGYKRLEVRNPFEDQWEYACRAGTSTAYSWGNHINSDLVNFIESGLKAPVKIGSYPPNPWGFYDMHGNVSEWCNVREQNGKRVFRGGDYIKSNHGGMLS